MKTYRSAFFVALAGNVLHGVLGFFWWRSHATGRMDAGIDASLPSTASHSDLYCRQPCSPPRRTRLRRRPLRPCREIPDLVPVQITGPGCRRETVVLHLPEGLYPVS